MLNSVCKYDIIKDVWKKGCLIVKDKYLQMTQSPIPGLVLRLSVPTIISMLVTSLYNMVDTYYVGMMENTNATAAVGAVFSFMSLIQAFGFFFGHGSGNYISRKLGAKEGDKAGVMAANGFFLALIFGFVIMIVGFLFLTPISAILGGMSEEAGEIDEILPYIESYLFYILIGAPYMTASLVLNNQLRFQGNAFYAMIGIASGAVLNVALDPLFMFVFDMGVAGAALATIISQFAGFVILYIGVARSGNVKIKLRNFRPTWEYLKEICRGGFPSLCRQGLASVATICLSFVASAYGAASEYGRAATLAGISVTTRIMQFASAALIGFGQGFQPICGFNYGAKNYRRVSQAFWFCLCLSGVALVVLAIPLTIFTPRLITLFRDDPNVVAVGTLCMRLQCVVLPLNAWHTLSNMMLQATGSALPASILAAARQGLFFIPLLFLFAGLWGVTGIQITQAVSDVLSFLIAIPLAFSFFRKMRRMENENKKSAPA